MKTLIIFLLSASACAQPLPRADKWKFASATAFHAGSALADSLTTIHGENRGCVETHSFLYGTHPTAKRLAISNAIEVGGSAAFGWFILKHTSGRYRWFAYMMPGTFGTLHLKAATQNPSIPCGAGTTSTNPLLQLR